MQENNQFQALIGKIANQINVNLNPTVSRKNGFTLFTLLLAIYGMAKQRQIQNQVEESGLLKTLPALHARPVPGSARPGETPIFRHHAAPLTGPLLETPWPGVVSLWHNFQRGVRLFPHNKCLGTRTPSGGCLWLTYAQVEEKAISFGSGLKDLTHLHRQEFVGFCLQNCAQVCNCFFFFFFFY